MPQNETIPATPSSLPPNGAAGGDLTGTYPNPTIAALAVTNAKLAAGAAVANIGANGLPVADLAAGLAGQVIGGTGPAYAYPPGFEIAYDQIVSVVNIASTTEGTPTTIIAGTAHTYENVPYLFQFFTNSFTPPSLVGGRAIALLIEDGASIGRLAYQYNEVAGTQEITGSTGWLRFTPSAGSHTFGIAAFASSTTGTPNIGAGSGGAGADVPAFLRATKC